MDLNKKLSVSLGGAIKKPLRDLMVADSQTAVLECEVANPAADGRWLKDGQPVDFNDNTLSEVDGAVRRLVIVITKGTDIGEYVYQVATSKTSANLKVEGRWCYIYIYIRTHVHACTVYIETYTN